MLELNFSYHSYFQIDRTITHFSLLSGSQADNSLESNMATRRHIGLQNAKNNPRNEFPISKLCKIDPLHTFQPYVFQKLIIALNPIWRPAAILDLRHFPESDWWGFLGCDYWGTKGMKSAEKPFVWIFSTLNITVGLDWLAYMDTMVTLKFWTSSKQSHKGHNPWVTMAMVLPQICLLLVVLPLQQLWSFQEGTGVMLQQLHRNRTSWVWATTECPNHFSGRSKVARRSQPCVKGA